MDIQTTSEFENITFEGADFAQLKVTNKVFTDCHFVNANFASADFFKSTFTECSFVNCNLSNVSAEASRMKDVRFENCKMLGFNFAKCDPWLLRVSFNKCLLNLSNFSMLNLGGTSFKGSLLHEVDFIETNLAKCDFTECDLLGARISRSDLRGANFVTAKNYLIDPRNNKVQNARFGTPGVLSLLSAFDIQIE